ncbi:MAG TPA: hypothetical protein VFN77_07400 [Acetobacteraceae bacterium]|nr:hypothetical protein [Acetobacteraceae bacterium]
MAAANKLRDADAREILSRAALPPEARAALGNASEMPHMEMPDIAERLVSAGFLIEAARCYAHALPRREAVWWACMCALHTARDDLPEPDRMAREAAESWVRSQSEESRRAAMELAGKIGFQSPEAWAAVGAFWSGPTLGPPGAPPNPPAPHLAGLAVAGAVALAAVRGEASKRTARLGRFLVSARDIAAGGAGRIAAMDEA